MKKNIIFILAIIVAFSGIALILCINFYKVFDYYNVSIISILIGIISTLISSRVFLNKQYPKAYNVAIIGFPKTGKTTLLTMLLGEILYNRIISYKAVISGEATINKLNENLNKIKRGEPVGATTDETKFAYRTNISVGNVFKENYKVEFGDFPGEYSQDFSTKPDWLKNTPFFNWAIEADAFVFVIDVSICFIPDGYFPYFINDIITGYMAAWQHILDANPDRINKLRKNPIILAFTKCDIIEDEDILCIAKDAYKREELLEKTDEYIYEKLIYKVGIDGIGYYKQPTTNIKNISAQEILERIVYDCFRDLISYFEKENSNTKIIFTSAFVKEKDDTVLGTKSLLNNILPKS